MRRTWAAAALVTVIWMLIVVLAKSVYAQPAPMLKHGEINPGQMAPKKEDCEGWMVFLYTEAPCRQLAVCENPYLPEGLSPAGYYPSWWCTEINGVLHQCRWMFAMKHLPSYDHYYTFWHARRSIITPCDGQQDECRVQKGFASEMDWGVREGL
jgi:hypothetical protein